MAKGVRNKNWLSEKEVRELEYAEKMENETNFLKKIGYWVKKHKVGMLIATIGMTLTLSVGFFTGLMIGDKKLEADKLRQQETLDETLEDKISEIDNIVQDKEKEDMLQMADDLIQNYDEENSQEPQA